MPDKEISALFDAARALMPIGKDGHEINAMLAEITDVIDRHQVKTPETADELFRAVSRQHPRQIVTVQIGGEKYRLVIDGWDCTSNTPGGCWSVYLESRRRNKLIPK